MRYAVGSAVALACVVVSVQAQAQAALETRLSSRTVEVGERFRLELSAVADGSSASNPRLPLPAGVAAEGPSMGRQTQVSITNGRMQQSTRVSATWTLIASRPGTYRLGPPSIEIDGRVERGQQAVVEVVPQGSTPRRRTPLGTFPFDLFDLPDPTGGRGFPGLGDLDPDASDLPAYPPEYALERAPDPLAFVVTKVAPQRVVVGEAVRLDVIAYGARGEYQTLPSTEPSREGFLAYDVKENPRSYAVPIEGTTYLAKRVNAFVLFPVRTGTLKIGSATFEFFGHGYSQSRQGSGLKRETQTVNVIVTEPPLAGRPPGYRVGDVGRYRLSANVEPKTVTEGSAVSVVVKLEGTGNVPASLQPPQQKGVEWLEPSTSEQIEASEGKVEGYRTFTYVVKLEQAGEIDLGELSLPFYDPAKRGYDVARARLGKVIVKPDPAARAAKAALPEPVDALRNLLPARNGLGAPVSTPSYLADRSAFWAALAFGPLAVLAAGAATRLGRGLLQRRRLRRELPEERAARELDRARHARSSDPSLAAACSERAVVLAIESATGLKARGVLRSDLPAELGARGVRPDLSSEIVGLLDRCEGVRFSGASAEEANQAVETAAQIVQAFTRGKWK
jgi:hypothetical protein